MICVYCYCYYFKHKAAAVKIDSKHIFRKRIFWTVINTIPYGVFTFDNLH